MASDFLTTAAKTVVATQMLQYHDAAKASMNSLVSQRTAIVTQLNAMKTNSDYTPEDIAAVQAMQDDIDNTAKAIVAAL